MNKRFLYSLLLMAGGLFVSCDPDKVDDIDFGVNLRNNAQEVYVGDEVVFDFSGNPDYIVFYSGEDGKKYANKDRLKVEVESMKLSYTIKQQYTEPPYQNRASIHIYISENFNGAYTADGINKATWVELSGTEEGQLKVPTCTGSNVRTETVSDEADFSTYKDKKFFLAFRYETPEAPELNKDQPRIDVQPLTLVKEVEGSIITMTNPSKEFGFNYVYLKGKTQKNYGADDSKLLFQPKETQNEEIDVWAISQQMDAASVAPDQGEPIKALDMKSPSYSYIYKSPGEYTVTFVASNTNMWNSESAVKEMKITVKERVE